MSNIVPTDTLSTQELPNLLRRWMTLQEEIATLNAEVKERRTTGNALREMILKIMERNNLGTINISKGAIIHEVREVKQSMSTDYVAKCCKEFFNGDEAKASALITFINENRPKNTKHGLRLMIGDNASTHS